MTQSKADTTPQSAAQNGVLVWGPGTGGARARLEAAARHDPDRPECRRLRAALRLLDELRSSFADMGVPA